MALLMLIVGAVYLVVSVFLSFSAGFLTFVNGAVMSLLFFGLAAVLHKQEDILALLAETRENNRRTAEKTTCSKCGKEYDREMDSCPHCGTRPA